MSKKNTLKNEEIKKVLPDPKEDNKSCSAQGDSKAAISAENGKDIPDGEDKAGAAVPAERVEAVEEEAGTAPAERVEAVEEEAGTVPAERVEAVEEEAGTAPAESLEAVEEEAGTATAESVEAAGTVPAESVGSAEEAGGAVVPAEREEAGGTAPVTSAGNAQKDKGDGTGTEAAGGAKSPGNTGVNVPDSKEMVLDGTKAQDSGKERRSRAAFWVALFVVLLVVAGVYAYGYRYCESHFMPGTRINGIDCSGMTAEEADGQFAKAAKNYVLNIRFRGGTTEMLSAEDMGFEYKPDGSIDALLQEQDQLCWMKYFFEDSSYTITQRGTTDDGLVAKALEKLPELQKENMEKPENAYITFQDGTKEQDGRFVIIPDTEGSTIETVQLEAAVTDAASRYEGMIDAEEKDGVYVAAEVTKDNAKLISRCNDLNDIVGASITYELPDGETMKINSDVMKDWLVRDKKGRLVKDDEVWAGKVEAFLEEVAYNANTIGMGRKFQSTLRGTITVRGGDYGYMVDQITEKKLLLEDLAAGKKDTREPCYHISPYNKETENDGIGTSYIEVDLGAQHIWCYVNGELKMDCDCVSGNASDGHDTPTGVFGIMFMDKDATLQGAMQSNGKYEYETKVSYWMPFYAECGFHDAWWRTAFGGTVYLKDGSHGCVNLPVEGAKELFSWCDVKMPVVVYR